LIAWQNITNKSSNVGKPDEDDSHSPKPTPVSGDKDEFLCSEFNHCIDITQYVMDTTILVITKMKHPIAIENAGLTKHLALKAL